MKLKHTIIAGMATLATAAIAAAAPISLVFTGATAFRAAANNTFLNVLNGVEYAYTGTSGLSGSNRTIFKGTIGAQDYIIRCSWSGSTAGVLALADQAPVQVLKTTVTTSTTGVNNPGGVDDFETAVPRWSFSDVDKLLSTRPNAPLGGGPVGVVPFMFVAGESAPAGVTNMTDQLHNYAWSNGTIPASFFTGNQANYGFTLYSTGRNDGSGTRATILAETQYGAFTAVVQFNSSFTGDRLTGSLTGAPTLFAPGGNGGNSSNSGVRDLLTRASNSGHLTGNYAFVSYLTISDALPATGTEGAKAMTYNGVAYSVDNVKNGAYSLWGYQQLYTAADATAEELAFDAILRAPTGIPANMGTAGIPIPDMSVDRVGGDGGVIVDQD